MELCAMPRQMGNAGNAACGEDIISREGVTPPATCGPHVQNIMTSSPHGDGRYRKANSHEPEILTCPNTSRPIPCEYLVKRRLTCAVSLAVNVDSLKLVHVSEVLVGNITTASEGGYPSGVV